MSDFSPLSTWVNGKSSLRPFHYFKKSSPEYELGAFSSLDICKPLYEILEFPAQSLSNSWMLFRNYVKSALKIIRVDKFNTKINLDHEECYWIKEELGSPPKHCYPIYIVTVGSGNNERIVYIGKTSSKIKRFAGGHRVAVELHNPKYNGYEKKVYLCCVVFLTKEESLPLEWVHPLKSALEILDSVESELIYHFKPELNIMKKNMNYSKYPINFHIQNFSNVSKLLHDYFIQNY